MSMALYRRYRPQRFQDVIGQEQVTKPLMAALRADKTAHAYLFSGPRGCGKTTSARILARCLNCAEAPTDSPCGECESCRELSLEGSGSLDVVEMDAASHGGVDDARDLIERASFAPARDRYKIFIIDEAHMVSNQGFNALLKLVEEPPPHIKFIFATTEPEKVIGTIRSRTHHYPFRLVPPDVLERFLAQICDEEGIDVGAGVLPLVVRSGGGSVRDSLSVLDQLIGGSEGSTLNYQDAVGLLGYTDGSLLDDVVDALAANDGATVFSVVDRVVQSGHDPRRFVEDLLQRLRDLIVIALAGESATDVLASVPRDQYERMVAQSNHLGAARASRCADLVNEALSAMVGATSPRLQLELLCARLLLPEPAAEAAGVQGEQAPVEHPARPAAAQRPQGQRPASAQRSEQPAGNRAPANPTPRGRQIDPGGGGPPPSAPPPPTNAQKGASRKKANPPARNPP
ncbi:DNA polymerase III subunit gamma and tau, partial [Actinomycetaceae bacterium L2_0104]